MCAVCGRQLLQSFELQQMLPLFVASDSVCGSGGGKKAKAKRLNINLFVRLLSCLSNLIWLNSNWIKGAPATTQIIFLIQFALLKAIVIIWYKFVFASGCNVSFKESFFLHVPSFFVLFHIQMVCWRWFHFGYCAEKENTFNRKLIKNFNLIMQKGDEWNEPFL